MTGSALTVSSLSGYLTASVRAAQRDRLVELIAAVLLLLSMPTAANAARTCSISTTNVVFGNVDVTTGFPSDVLATLSVTCSGYGGDPPRLCISIGAGSAGDSTSRMMSGGVLRYDLYTDTSHSQIWGSWQSGYQSPGVEWTGADGTNNFFIYARILGSQQTIAPGSYSSTFTANPFLRYGRTSGSSPCPGPLNEEQTASTSFTVTATVVSSCQVSVADLSFGSVASLNANLDAASTLTTRCSNGTPYNVGLNAGIGAGATVATRKATSGGNTIDYSLYRDNARTQVWGFTIGSDTSAGTGSGVDQNLSVYGRVPVQATPPSGTYNDTITATVTY